MLKHIAFGVRERWRLCIEEQLRVDGGGLDEMIAAERRTGLFAALLATTQPIADCLAIDAFDQIAHHFLPLW